MVSILIVNWNTRDLLRACLRSIASLPAEVPHEVIVVDNDSRDGSADMVRAEFPSITLIANADNVGYAAANNQAYRAAIGDLIWLLNPDTEIWDANIGELSAFLLADARRAAVASMLVDARSGLPQSSCRTFPGPAALWAEALGLARAFPRSHRYGFYRMGWWNYRDTRQVEQPMTSSLLLRREAIEAAGGLFDEQFPIFFNDVDLCWRLREGGGQIWYHAESRVLHHGGASTSQVKPAMIASSHRALAAFHAKHYRSRIAWPLYAATLLLIQCSGRWRVSRAERRVRASG